MEMTCVQYIDKISEYTPIDINLLLDECRIKFDYTSDDYLNGRGFKSPHMEMLIKRRYHNTRTTGINNARSAMERAKNNTRTVFSIALGIILIVILIGI